MSNVFDFNSAKPQLQLVDGPGLEDRLDALRSALRSRAADLVHSVFPLARASTHEARIGDVDGAPGESLAISLTGDTAGQWFDHATGVGGDLIELWQQVQACDFLTAVDDLERWAGLSAAPAFTSRVAKVAEARAKIAKEAPAQPEGLGPATASWYYYGNDGRLRGTVRRYDLPGQFDAVTGKQKKTFRPNDEAGRPRMPDPRPLYRIPSLQTASAVVLVEGEKCADALERIGIEATTAMGGAGADPSKTDWTPLAGKRVLVWEDNDAAGAVLCERVRPYLEAIGCEVRPVPLPAGKPPKWDAADAVDEGEDVNAILNAAGPFGPLQVTTPAALPATTAQAAQEGRKLRLLDVDALDALKPPEWLLDNIAPAGGFVSLYGQHASLKSFVALDWSLCVAWGRDWLGRKVRQGPVIYVAGEGQSGLGVRIAGWKRANEVSGKAPFFVVPAAVAMTTPQLDELLALIAGINPALIVLDTLARTFGPGDENNQRDMNAFVAAVDRLREATSATVLVVHHTGKDEGKGARGSSALPGAVDTNIFVKRDLDRVTLKNKAPHGKQKDAEEFDDIALTFQVVPVIRGDVTLTTLVLQEDDRPQLDPDAPERTQQLEPKLGKNENLILDLLTQARDTDRQNLGVTSIATVTRIGNEGSVRRACRTLVEKGLLQEHIDGAVITWSRI